MNFDALQFQTLTKKKTNEVVGLVNALRMQCLNKKLEQTINEIAARDPNIMLSVSNTGMLTGAMIKKTGAQLAEGNPDFNDLPDAYRHEQAAAEAWKAVFDEYPELYAAVSAPISRIPITDDRVTDICIQILQAVVDTSALTPSGLKQFKQKPDGKFWQEEADMEAVVRAVNRFRERLE